MPFFTFLYRKSGKLVRSFGYDIVNSTKYHMIVDVDGNPIMSFAIAHSKKGKREIKSYYINEFFKKIKELS